jgi:hypothetical protein
MSCLSAKQDRSLQANNLLVCETRSSVQQSASVGAFLLLKSEFVHGWKDAFNNLHCTMGNELFVREVAPQMTADVLEIVGILEVKKFVPLAYLLLLNMGLIQF